MAHGTIAYDSPIVVRVQWFRYVEHLCILSGLYIILFQLACTIDMQDNLRDYSRNMIIKWFKSEQLNYNILSINPELFTALTKYRSASELLRVPRNSN